MRIKQPLYLLYIEMRRNGILEKYCANLDCMMWDGFGRWANNEWKPYLTGKPQYVILDAFQSDGAWFK